MESCKEGKFVWSEFNGKEKVRITGITEDGVILAQSSEKGYEGTD